MGIAGSVIIAIIVFSILVAFARRGLLNYPVRRRNREAFDGVVYLAGKAAIAMRSAGENPRATVIGMHGFCEDPRYFTEYYSDPDIQLILISSCDYHMPFTGGRLEKADWAGAPWAMEGSIEYDARALVQALENLPRSDTIRVHGHSRGGAVVLEAAALHPELFANVEVVLEAPVLPQGRSVTPLSPVLFWLGPFVAVLWRLMPISPLNRRAYGSLENPRKRELLAGLPFNAKRASTLIANMRYMDAWMRVRQHDIYRSLQRGVVLVPEKDRVLEPEAMRQSARQVGSGVEVVPVAGSSHFVLMDCPQAIPALW